MEFVVLFGAPLLSSHFWHIFVLLIFSVFEREYENVNLGEWGGEEDLQRIGKDKI